MLDAEQEQKRIEEKELAERTAEFNKIIEYAKLRKDRKFLLKIAGQDGPTPDWIIKRLNGDYHIQRGGQLDSTRSNKFYSEDGERSESDEGEQKKETMNTSGGSFFKTGKTIEDDSPYFSEVVNHLI